MKVCCDIQVRIGDPHHGAAERRVTDPEERRPPTCLSASVRVEPKKADGRFTESCAPMEPQPCHPPMGVRGGTATIPLAARIRHAYAGEVHDTGANKADESATGASCHPPSIGSRVKSATTESSAQPSATTAALDKLQQPPANSDVAKKSKPPHPKAPTTKKGAPPRPKAAGTQKAEQPPANSAFAKEAEQPASKASATKKVAQPPANSAFAMNSQQPILEAPTTKKGASAVQATPSTQSRPKQNAKRAYLGSGDGPTAPTKKQAQGDKASSARSVTHKRPHIDIAATTDSSTPPQVTPLWLTPPGAATNTAAINPEAVQAMPWQSQPQAPAESRPPQHTASIVVHEGDQKQADTCGEPLAENAPVCAPSDLLQQSTTNLLDQWMVQEDSGAASGLLQIWCASASAQQPENGSAARDVEAEVGTAIHRPQMGQSVLHLGSIHADGAEHAKQSAQGAAHATTGAQQRVGAPKRRFQPTGRATKKPSIQLSFDTWGPSPPAERDANVRLHVASSDAERPCGASEATLAAPAHAPVVPPASGSDSAAGAMDSVVSAEPVIHADALPASQSAPAGQPDAHAGQAHDFDAALQQPDAATLNIMLQNIAKHGALGSSTAQIPTRLLQSMAQCMDKLLQQQQQSKQDAGPTAVPTEHDPPEHDEAHYAQYGTAGQSSAKVDLHSDDEAAQLPPEQLAAVERSCPDAALDLPDIPFPVASAPVCMLPAAEAGDTSGHSPSPSTSCGTGSDDTGDAVHGMKEPTDGVAEAAQAQGNSVPCPQQDSAADDVVEARSAALMERQRNVEVEEMEWARRQAELEKQRRAVQAERRARAEQNAVVRARAQREKEQADMEQRSAMRSDLQGELSRVVLPGMSLRQALIALGFHPGPGSDGEKAALKQARVFHHPDSSRRRGDTLRQQIMSEEIFKLLGSLV